MSHLATTKTFERTAKQFEYDPPEAPERPESPLDVDPRALEEGAFILTHEKKYYDLRDQYCTYVKRSLSPSEYVVNILGKVVRPHFVKERLQNEVAAIAFLKANTTIPLPNVRCAFEDHGRYYIIMDTVPGIEMVEVPLAEQGPILEELAGYREQLRSLKSKVMGGLAGHACLPYRLHSCVPFDEVFKFREAETPEFVFIHGDLAQHNIIVDEKTHKINAIIDWEYAGYYPPEFEGAFWLRPGPSGALEGEEDDVEKLFEVVKEWRIL
ncbi:hypothetical protein C0995_011483 [Termitomyces sp. Mi166|nr:hypothetical protein C0995_011483 [Termitomyces sp. Mi166\